MKTKKKHKQRNTRRLKKQTVDSNNSKKKKEIDPNTRLPRTKEIDAKNTDKHPKTTSQDGQKEKTIPKN
jgi:hypothetical protein